MRAVRIGRRLRLDVEVDRLPIRPPDRAAPPAPLFDEPRTPAQTVERPLYSRATVGGQPVIWAAGTDAGGDATRR